MPGPGAGGPAVRGGASLPGGVDLVQQRAALGLQPGGPAARHRHRALQLLQVRLGPAQPGSEPAPQRTGQNQNQNQNLFIVITQSATKLG